VSDQATYEPVIGLEVHCELSGSATLQRRIPDSNKGDTPVNEPHPPDHEERIAAQLSQRIKDLIGISAQVRVLPPDSIERSAGKAKRVVDKRPK